MIYEIQAQEGEHGTSVHYTINIYHVAAVSTRGGRLCLYLQGGASINIDCGSAENAENHRKNITDIMSRGFARREFL